MQKRLRRYVLSTLLVMVLLLGAAFVVMTSETVVAEQDGDYTYTVAGSPLVATITDYTGADSIITIPSTLGGYPAVVIGQNAFQQCRFLTSVTIPNNVTTIGEYAFFSCTYLTSMTIGSGVTTIGDHAFLSCTALTSVTIGSGVTTIGNWTFQSCTSLTAIDFLGLTQPTSVGTGWIYGTDTDLRGYAYSTSDFPSSGKNFHGLIMAPVIPIVADYVYSVSGKKATIIGYTGADSIITIPSTLGGYPVAVIGQDAFLRCTGLTSVTIPDNVTTIGEYAFYYCTSLTSMTIGRGVTTISDYAFQSCTSLTSINFLGMTPPTSVGTDWIYGTDTDLRGHAYAASNFPPSGGNFYGLVMGTAIPVAPEAPINLTVTHASGKAVLTWVAPSVGPTVTHLIYRSDSANGTYVLIASCAAANYTDATVGVGQTYWYKVSANNSVVEGAKSVAVSVHITSPSANNDVSAILALIIVVVLLLLALMVMWRSSKGHR